MSPRVSIPMRLAKWLADNVEQSWPGSGAQAAVRELREALQPKRSVIAAKKVKAKKTRTKSKDTKSIRAAVMERSQGNCECGCGMYFTALAPAHLDHFFGRVRVKQSPSNCWAIRADCDRAKTLNQPSSEWWLQKFIRHAEKHGFHAEFRMAASRLQSLEIQGEVSR